MLDGALISFLSSLGPAFGLGFVGLSALSTYQILQCRSLADESARTAERATTRENTQASARLAELRGELAAAVSRAQISIGAIPSLALLGTVMGFFFAISRAGAMDLASADPLSILQALMDGGISTALATTVLGQAIYLVLGQAWAFGAAGQVERADALLQEVLEQLRLCPTGTMGGGR